MPALPPTIPCGRSELLAWVNQLCKSEYPTVEALRDGAAYCTIIEAGVSRIGKNCAAAGFPDYNGATQKAEKCKGLLSKVDWSATAHVYEATDPGQDTAQISAVCLKNMTLLQQMIRLCVFREISIEIHPPRLSSGKLQEHLQFLTWLCGFIKKVLTQYTRTEISRKNDPLLHSVEGVKLNRAMMLLEEKRLGKPVLSRHTVASDNRTGQRVLPSSSVTTRISRVERSPAQRAISCPPSSERSSLRMVSETIPNTQLLQRRSSTPLSFPTPTHMSNKLGLEEIKENYVNEETEPSCDPGGGKMEPQQNAAPSHSRSRHQNDTSSRGGTRRPFRSTCDGRASPIPCVSIPSSYKDSVVDLRGMIEELEQLIWKEHEEYQNSIVPAGVEICEVDEVPPQSGAGERIISLHNLGKLLEERDKLAQTYMAVEEIIKENVTRGMSTPLLMNICSVFYPSQDI